ncbi:MAG: glycosyltransferase [Candidatus Aenigmarchaeota archaeon]|nr:glycosyltransferase [Candidatus Aenigmarchaeota archaeon]
MKISVIIPTKDYDEGLRRCLTSISKQDYKNKEIIVVGTKEETSKIAKEFGAKFFLDKAKTIGNSYSVGAKNAKGGVVAFLDDDCIALKNWLTKINKEFENDKDLMAFGGEDIIDEKRSSYFQTALFQLDIPRIYKSIVYGKRARDKLRACNIAYRRSVFSKFDFNKDLISLQEPELHHRLYESGAKMKFDPSIIVYHERRKNIKSVFKQMYRNGKAKIAVIGMHKKMIAPYDILMFLSIVISLISVISLTFTSRMLTYWVALLLLYFILKPVIILMKTRNMRFYFTLFKIVFVRELAYALGLISGIFGK